jgi:hypothetical protein
MASSLRGSQQPQPGEQFDILYSKRQWKQDAALVIELWREVEGGGFPHLAGLISDQDINSAKTLLKVIDSNTRQNFREKALDSIHSQNSSANSVDAFNRFLTRFREGPPENEPDTNSEASRGGRGFGRGNHNNGNRPNSRGSLPSRGNGAQRGRGNGNRQHQNYYGAYGAGGDNPGDSSDDDDEYNRYRRFKEFERRERGKQTRPTAQNQRHRSSEEEAYQSGYSALFPGVKRLRVDEIGTFDGTDATPSAIAYGKRLSMLAAMYGEPPVLATLPLCMKDKAATWFYGLEDEVTIIMAESIEEWKIQLVRRFHTNPSQALVQADSMHHSFANESELDVREYISRKHGLYVEAGETNQDNIVRRIHDGLDPTLAAAVTLRASNNTMNDFQAKVYAAEHQARQQYRQLQTRLDSIEKEHQEMKNLMTTRPQIQYAIPAKQQDNFRGDRFSRYNRNRLDDLPKVSFKEVTEEVETLPAARRLTAAKQTELSPGQDTGSGNNSSSATTRQYPYQNNNNRDDGVGSSNTSWRGRNNYGYKNNGGYRNNNFTPRQARVFLVDTDEDNGEREFVMVDRDTFEQYQMTHQTETLLVNADQDENGLASPDIRGDEGNARAGR